jgi:hypothetical protein
MFAFCFHPEAGPLLPRWREIYLRCNPSLTLSFGRPFGWLNSCHHADNQMKVAQRFSARPSATPVAIRK